MPDPEPDYEAILRVLAEHRADFIVIGGVSAVLQGTPITTFDLDVVHSRAPENLDLLGTVTGNRSYEDLVGHTVEQPLDEGLRIRRTTAPAGPFPWPRGASPSATSWGRCGCGLWHSRLRSRRVQSWCGAPGSVRRSRIGNERPSLCGRERDSGRRLPGRTDPDFLSGHAPPPVRQKASGSLDKPPGVDYR
jgi:hypothetical protein